MLPPRSPLRALGQTLGAMPIPPSHFSASPGGGVTPSQVRTRADVFETTKVSAAGTSTDDSTLVRSPRWRKKELQAVLDTCPAGTLSPGLTITWSYRI